MCHIFEWFYFSERKDLRSWLLLGLSKQSVYVFWCFYVCGDMWLSFVGGLRSLEISLRLWVILRLGGSHKRYRDIVKSFLYNYLFNLRQIFKEAGYVRSAFKINSNIYCAFVEIKTSCGITSLFGNAALSSSKQN